MVVWADLVAPARGKTPLCARGRKMARSDVRTVGLAWRDFHGRTPVVCVCGGVQRIVAGGTDERRERDRVIRESDGLALRGPS